VASYAGAQKESCPHTLLGVDDRVAEVSASVFAFHRRWRMASLRDGGAHSEALAAAMEQITQPFPQTYSIAAAPTVASHNSALLPLLLLALWVCVSLTLAFSWWRKWRHVSVAVRAASPLAVAADVPVLLSSSLLEPGIFGVIRPVLLLPEGIVDRLTPAQLNAIVAHEMCHVRRRDNLTFALHMLVETLFWFHPLVWWIRARLVDERECACDEFVLQSGGAAEVYAEGILNVCKYYVESPLACVSGVTGSDLKKRIVRIMTEQVTRKLGFSRKLLIGVAGLIAVAMPVSFGLVHAAQTQQTKPLQFEVAAIRPGHPKPMEDSSSSSHGGRFQMVNTPLRQWVEMGLSVSDYALKAPSWLDTSRFDLNAKFPEGQPSSQNAFAEMMKSLLVERFGMKWHEENGTVSGYELVTDKKVLAQPASLLERLQGAHGSAYGPTSLQGTNMPMSELAEKLGDALGKPVVDATHLTGGYDFNLMWRPLDNAAPTEDYRRYWKQKGINVDDLPSSVSAALQEKLGLRLQSAKVPSRVIVVDQINRQPTAN
jgi:uncharacterized protein (TIGR03435 family)